MFFTCFFSQVVFEGVVGSTYLSDIAIDDITVTNDDCPGRLHSILCLDSHLIGKNVSLYLDLAEGATAKAQGTTTISVGVVHAVSN